MATIPVVTEATSAVGGAKYFGKGKAESLIVAEMDTSVLQKSLAKLIDGLRDMVQIEDHESAIRLRQITVAVEISAEGGINLIGTMKAGGKSAITLTFER